MVQPIIAISLIQQERKYRTIVNFLKYNPVTKTLFLLSNKEIHIISHVLPSALLK